MAIRLDPVKAAGQSMVINWQFTDRDEKLALTLRHSTLTYRLGEWSDKATASVVFANADDAIRTANTYFTGLRAR